MRIVLSIILCLFLVTCVSDTPTVEKMTTNCYFLLDNMNGNPDTGGTWTWTTFPSGFTPPALVGDNPEVCMGDIPCGDYVLTYTVESTTCEDCEDSSTLSFNNTLCCDGFSVNITCETN